MWVAGWNDNCWFSFLIERRWKITRENTFLEILKIIVLNFFTIFKNIQPKVLSNSNSIFFPLFSRKLLLWLNQLRMQKKQQRGWWKKRIREVVLTTLLVSSFVSWWTIKVLRLVIALAKCTSKHRIVSKSVNYRRTLFLVTVCTTMQA